METSSLLLLLLLLASSSTGVLVDGFSTPSSPLCRTNHMAVSSSSSSLSVLPSTTGPGIIGAAHTWRNTIVYEEEEDFDVAIDIDEECLLTVDMVDGLLGSSAPPLPEFCETKTQLRLDGLEPYVLVSAITATASFGVVTGGNLFDTPMFGTGSVWEEVFRVTLLSTSTSSACLGLYALGIFSFSIMYSKAALARQDGAHDVYQRFFDATASHRYKGFQAFFWSLILLVVDLFLFALAYLPESAQPFAALLSAPIVYTCWKDWQDIVSAASIIYKPCQDDNDM